MFGTTGGAIKKSGGFTLIEVMMAIGVFAVTMTFFLQILMSVHRTNNALSASMTANSALRAMADEALSKAAGNMDGVAGEANLARAFVNYYGTLPAKTLPIGPGGTPVPNVELTDGGRTLTCSFAVPEPGSLYDAADPSATPYKRGMGRMVIYLDESIMASLPGAYPIEGGLTAQGPLTGGGNLSWETSGNTGDPGDGGLVPGTVFTGADLRNPPADLTRVFADLTVTYYEADGSELTTNQRRILVMGALKGGGDRNRQYDGSLPPPDRT